MKRIVILYLALMGIVPIFLIFTLIIPDYVLAESSKTSIKNKSFQEEVSILEMIIPVLSSLNAQPSDCGAYVAPGVWKEFDCYNLAAIGKTTNDDPFTPSWRLIGGYWQWGRKGPDSSQWYDTNTANFAHGPTGSGSSEANDGDINGWDYTYADNGSWSDTSKTAKDPCPDGYRVPTRANWDGVIDEDNNTQSTVGSWYDNATNYSSARFFGDKLMLPAAGRRSTFGGPLYARGYYGYYWSSTEVSGSSYYSWYLLLCSMSSGAATDSDGFFRDGFSVRCIAE